MEANHRFFSNRNCKYFPCHAAQDVDIFNCLFCYCPLYFFKDECGGSFTFDKNGVKQCAGCHLPHTPEYYDAIVETLKNPKYRISEKL